MRTRSWLLASLFEAAVMVALGRAALRRLPAGARLPTHWGADGVVNGWTDASRAIWIMPGVLVVGSLLLAAIPHIEPRQEKLAQSAPVLKVSWAAMMALLALAHGAITGAAFGWHFPAWLPMAGAGAMLIAIGNVLPKSRPGFFVGIRTPWALTDDDNWIATHRFGGRVFMAAGVAIVLAAVLPMPAAWRHALVLGSALLAAGSSYLFSWWLWRSRRA